MAEGSVCPLPPLDEDVIHYEILPRLPAKALMRLQCVSRGWRSLISSDHHFSLLQSRLGAASPCALLMAREEPRPRFLCRGRCSAVFPPLAPQFHGGSGYPVVVGCCAGILLVFWSHDSSDAGVLYVGNPVLQDWAPVPPHDWLDGPVPCDTGLAVYEVNGAIRYAIVDPLLKVGVEGVHGTHVEAVFGVFSSATGSWALSEECVAVRDWVLSVCSRACVGGRLYWWCVAKVFWFDAREASGGILPVPPGNWDCRESEMGEWDGKLSFMRPSPQNVDVWSWDGDGNSWYWMYTIELSQIRILQPHVTSVVGFAAGFVVVIANGLVCSFDVVTGQVQLHVRDYRLIDCVGFSYANTLLRLPAVPAVE